MKTEREVREKLEFLRDQMSIGNDPDATREIHRLEWVLGEGPDYIHVTGVK